MDINQAVLLIETFCEKYRAHHPWSPDEIKILPSGDDKNAIKIWFNYGPDLEDEAAREAITDKWHEALSKAHSEVLSFALEIRTDGF